MDLTQFLDVALSNYLVTILTVSTTALAIDSVVFYMKVRRANRYIQDMEGVVRAAREREQALMEEYGRVEDIDAKVEERQIRLERIEQSIIKLQKERDVLVERMKREIKEFQDEHHIRQKAFKILANNEFTKELELTKFELEKRKWELEELKKVYAEKHAIFTKLQNKNQMLEDDLEMMDYGIYKPHYNFDYSETYKNALANIRTRMKDMVRSKKAATCSQQWTVEGSKQKGKQMVDRQIRLMLRAFNGECDAAVMKVRWNNVNKMEAIIDKAFNDFNKIGEPTALSISTQYKNQRLEELHLAYEHEAKVQDEKEEQRRIREQEREDAKVQKEIQDRIKKSMKEEEVFEKALEKARAELDSVMDEEKETLARQIEELERQLAEAHAAKERALSQAQLTRAGHVYVLSNVGSFGKGVYKIGLTRRLEPLERVKELGDASVPFGFDVHALIYCEDAPALESALHQKFDRHRVNLANTRKEFFKVPLTAIEQEVRKMGQEIEFIRSIEAQELRQTLSLRNYSSQGQPTTRREQLPSSI